MRFNLVWIIVAREVRERTRSKFFRIGLALTVILVVMGVVIPSLAQKPDKVPTYAVGVTEPASEQLLSSIQDTGPSVGARLIVEKYNTVDEGEHGLTSGGLVALVIPNQQVEVKTAVDPSLVDDATRIATAIAATAGNYSALEQSGLDDNQTSTVLGHGSLPVHGLQAAAHRSAKGATAANVGILVLFVFLNLYGAFILNGVIEEKTSRVVEILLSTVRAEELLLGKVIGIGIVGSIQGIVLVIATVIARANASTVSSGSLTPALVMYTILWFIIGFGLYAWMYACAGALVSRSEDSQSLVLILQLPLLISYVVAFVAINNGPSTLDTAMSMFPFTAPMTMLERMSAQEAPLWQIGVSIGLCLISIVLVMRLAVTIFQGGVLKSGARVKIKDALKATNR